MLGVCHLPTCVKSEEGDTQVIFLSRYARGGEALNALFVVESHGLGVVRFL